MLKLTNSYLNFNMKKRCFIVFAFLLSCAEETTFTTTKLKNSSGKDLKIEIFQSGLVAKRYDIPNQSEITVYENNNKGKGTGLSFPNIDISMMDSALVTYDGKRQAVHFSGLHTFDSSRVIYFGHPRNLFTQRNYSYTVKSETHKRIENEYEFIFNEQDYLEAKWQINKLNLIDFSFWIVIPFEGTQPL